MMNPVLVLIDLQNDYFPGGTMELIGIDAAAVRAAKVLKHWRDQGWPVIHIQHISNRPGATFFLPGTSGMEIHDSVKPLPTEPVLTKNYPNGFRDTALLERLQALAAEKLFVCGAMTHMCIDSTVRAAFDLGFSCTLVSDACATRDLVALSGETVPAAAVQQAFLAALGSVFAKLVTSEELLADL